MRSHGRFLAAAALSVGLVGCSTVQSAQRQAVRYNSAFSGARNEILLLNILRAKHREPLQFSTISTVTGSMRGTIGATAGLDWIFSGADKVRKFLPGASLGLRDPSVTLTPLDSKEFREGMMKAVEWSYYNELLEQGWDKSIVNELLRRTTICTSDPPPRTVVREVWTSGADAAKILRDGAGKNTTVELVTASDGPKGQLVLRFKSEPPQPEGVASPARCAEGAPHANVRLRSPLEIVMTLGSSVTIANDPGTASLQSPNSQGAFTIVAATGRILTRTLVATAFRDKVYYIREGDVASAQRLALLAEIIGFQTTNAALNASKPTVTIPTD